MLAVDSEHIPSTMQSAQEQQIEPSLSEVDVSHPKQETKRKLLTPLNIMIFLGALALIGIGSYYLLNINSEKDMKNKINESHKNIISYADSSKKDGSNSGSTSSKSSSNNDKPNTRSQPAGKDVISSNGKLTGSSGSPPNGGGDDEEDEDGDGDSSKKKHTLGSSTEEDSQEDSEEGSEEESGDEPVLWVDSKAPGNTSPPMVGNARDGGR